MCGNLLCAGRHDGLAAARGKSGCGSASESDHDRISSMSAHGRRVPIGSCFNKYALTNMNKHISQNMRHMISLLFWRNAVYWISGGGADFLPPSLSFRHSSLSCQINRFPTRMRHPAIGRYRSDIQGLRAIAVVSVVLYHSSKAALTLSQK